MLGGTRRREGRRHVERTTARKHGRGHGPRKPVNEMALDSRTGEEEAGNGAVLAEPCHRLRMDARSLHTNPQGWATGIDGVTAQDYEANLEANLRDLLERIKSGSYEAPPVRRTYIPKADGSQRRHREQLLWYWRLFMSRTFCHAHTASGQGDLR